MNKRLFYKTGLPVLVVALSSFLAVPEARASACDPQTKICLNQRCDEGHIGVSQMDFDKKNIVYCLINSAGNDYVWKGQSASAGYPANHAAVYLGTNGYLRSTASTKVPVCAFATDGAGQIYIKIITMQDIFSNTLGATGYDGMPTPWIQTNWIQDGATMPQSAMTWAHPAYDFSLGTVCSADPAGYYMMHDNGTQHGTVYFSHAW